MSSNANWKKELAEILQAHNGNHARKNKVVSYRTRELRRCGLYRCIGTLRQLGFEVGPRSLVPKHVQALMHYWTANPKHVEHYRKCGLKIKRYSTSFIQQHLSFLRVLCLWIGKDGMIKSAASYVDDPALVSRQYAATDPHGWLDKGIDVAAVVAEVTRRNIYVGIQLALMLAFGLRRKEAVMFVPAHCMVPADALPLDHANKRYLMFVRVKKGTKGGRLRFVAIRTEFQQQVLEQALQLAGQGHVGQPGLSLEQSLNLFSNTLRAAGVTMEKLGVTPHGTRHQFASDLFVDITDTTPPVAGGSRLAPDILQAAYLEVARQLGHNRTTISSAYLGSPHKPGSAASDD